jgi:hypothetical protein
MGERLGESDFCALRSPEKGLSVAEHEATIGRTLLRPIAAYSPIRPEDLR